MQEKTIVNNILKYLKSLPACFCWKQHGGAYGSSGLPDIICCVSGRFVAFEVKRPAGDGHAAGKLTKLQEIAIARIRTAGGIAAKVTSLEEVKELLQNMQGLKTPELEDIVIGR
jgi:hypothetical protein